MASEDYLNLAKAWLDKQHAVISSHDTLTTYRSLGEARSLIEYFVADVERLREDRGVAVSRRPLRSGADWARLDRLADDYGDPLPGEPDWRDEPLQQILSHQQRGGRVMDDDVVTAVVEWLSDIGYPFDFSAPDHPLPEPLRRPLAEAYCRKHGAGESVDDWMWSISEEGGW